MCVIVNSDRLAHCKPIAVSLGLLMLDDVYQIRCLTLMFNIKFKIDLSVTREFAHVSNIVSYNLRNVNNVAQIGCRLALRQLSFVYSSVDFWNHLPVEIADLNNIKAIVNTCKMLFINTYLET